MTLPTCTGAMQGSYSKTGKDFTMSISLNPYGSTYFNRGIAWYSKVDYKKAAEDFTKTIDIFEEIQRAWEAELEKEYGKLNKKARKYFIEKANKKVSNDPMYAMAYTYRGNAKMGMKKVSEAFMDFNKAIEIDSAYAEPYFSRGLLNLVSGNKDKGCLDLNKAAGLGFAAAVDVIKNNCQ
jgi:tetratricopeptide (TPR) repeat protein